MDSDKRECIVVSAVKAFARFGFKKASIDEIAKEAGVAKGTVYLAAESKEDLLYQAVLHDLRDWNAQIAKMIDPRRDALELLAELARLGIETLDQRPLVKQLVEGDFHVLLPRWVDRLDELHAMCQRNTVEVLKLGVRQGRFRADLDVEETATLLMDLQVSTLMFHNRETPDREQRLLRRFAAALSLIDQGLKAPPPEHAPRGRSKTAHA
jgi:AcrR family transcriptional regulator